MNMIINPGSGAVEPSGEGWTNTHAQARVNAYEWFYKPMVEQGIVDVEVKDTKTERDGRWLFEFKHNVTGTVVELEIHGIDDMKAYEQTHIFGSRIYWNGSSSGNPELEDFAAPGFKPVMTFVEENEPL